MKKLCCLLSFNCLLFISGYAQKEIWSVLINLPVKETGAKTQYDIFLLDASGVGRNLTKHPDIAWVYKTNADKIFFISDRDTCFRCFFLYSMDIDGKGLEKVSELQLEDSWMSPRENGREWVVSGRAGASRMQLYIINTENGQYRAVTDDTAALYRDPVFSPDGKQIAFVYKKNRRDRSIAEEVFVMDSNGGEIKRLTYYPEKDSSGSKFGYRAGALRWHPTENFISYISMQNGHHSIFAVDPSGTRQWKISAGFIYEGWHDWSPDGKWLVFDQSDEAEEKYNVILMNWETKKTTKLNTAPFNSPPCPVFLRTRNN